VLIKQTRESATSFLAKDVVYRLRHKPGYNPTTIDNLIRREIDRVGNDIIEKVSEAMHSMIESICDGEGSSEVDMLRRRVSELEDLASFAEGEVK
jgi:hypothetical protein